MAAANTIDELTRAKSRLATWKAMASEAYVSLSSRDPVLTAFLTCDQIDRISNLEVHYKVSILYFFVFTVTAVYALTPRHFTGQNRSHNNDFFKKLCILLALFFLASP